MTKEAFFSGLTVVLYSIVAVFSVVAIVLGIMWAAGAFSDNKPKPTGLAFSQKELFIDDINSSVTVEGTISGNIAESREQELRLSITDLNGFPISPDRKSVV